MKHDESPASDANLIRPPPIPLNATTLGTSLRSSSELPPEITTLRDISPPAQPTNWKKILLIAGLIAVGVLALLAMTGALLFGSCMYLVEKAGK